MNLDKLQESALIRIVDDDDAMRNLGDSSLKVKAGTRFVILLRFAF